MVGPDDRQKSTRSSEPHNLVYLIPIDLTHNTGQKLGMPVPFEQIKTHEYLTKLIGTSNTFISQRVKRIETDRE